MHAKVPAQTVEASRFRVSSARELPVIRDDAR